MLKKQLLSLSLILMFSTVCFAAQKVKGNLTLVDYNCAQNTGGGALTTNTTGIVSCRNAVSSLTGLSDVGSATITAGRLLIADGTKFQSVTLSSDCVVTSSGATTCTGARPSNAVINRVVCWKNGTNLLGACANTTGDCGVCQ